MERLTSYDIYKAHARAFAENEGRDGLRRLLPDVEKALATGHADDAMVINYGAILLDLDRNREALEWLKAHPRQYREYYENLATAHAKVDRLNITVIRHNNSQAARYPSCPNAISAYIDYHGM